MSLNVQTITAQEVDNWDQPVAISLQDSSQVSYAQGTLDVSCTITVSSASFMINQGSPTLHDAYLIGLNLSLNPSLSIKLYRVTLRALQGTFPSQGPDPSAVSTIASGATEGKNIFNNLFRALDYSSPSMILWAQSPSTVSENVTLPNASWSQTQPASVGNTTSYTTSSELSLGANVGFSGEDPTGGLSATYTLSDSKTVNVIPVQIDNRSNDQALDVQFMINDDGEASDTFQPYITGLLQTDDDHQGQRSTNANVTDARELSFELTVWAMPDQFLVLGGSQPLQIVRTFQIRVPPLPVEVA